MDKKLTERKMQEFVKEQLDDVPRYGCVLTEGEDGGYVYDMEEYECGSYIHEDDYVKALKQTRQQVIDEVINWVNCHGVVTTQIGRVVNYDVLIEKLEAMREGG